MPFRDDLLTPISGSNPGGQDLRYDPVREKIKDARREEFEAPQGAWKTEFKTADWNLVTKLAGEALAKRSKDLQLAVWLVDGHVRKEGFPALAPGFDLLRGLVDDFWDALYPQIEDGDLEERAAILSSLDLNLERPLRLFPIVSGGLSWSSYKESLAIGTEADAKTQDLRKKREQLIGEGKISGEQWLEAVGATSKIELEKLRTSLDAALESVVRFGEVCDKRFLADSPGFSKIRSTIEETRDLIRRFIQAKGGPAATAAPARPVEPATPPEPSAAAVAQPVQVSKPVEVEPATTAASAGIDPVDLADAESRLAAICRFLRKKDTYDIAPFLILRGLRFGQVRYNGPHKIDPGMLEAPPSGLRAELKRLAAEQNWDELLEATQKAMELPCGRAWLDVQRFAVMALEGKGEWWTFVADAVRTELRSLLSDLPALLNMQLLDDTPTANPETKKWIEERVLSQLPATPAFAPAAIVESAPPDVPSLDNAKLDESGDEIFRKAVSDAGNGRLTEALDALTRQLASERSGRGRFLRRVQLAHLLMSAEQSHIALPILNELASEIEARSLETWEDWAALVYPLSLMLRCLETGTADRAAIYARICRLDPVRALSIRN